MIVHKSRSGVQVLPYFYVRCGTVVPHGSDAAEQFVATFHAALEDHLQQLAGSSGSSNNRGRPTGATHYFYRPTILSLPKMPRLFMHALLPRLSALSETVL